MKMKWHSRDELPPLSESAIRAGNTDGGWSVRLLHKHKSGRISTGQALLHDGKVARWYPGGFDDIVHAPETAGEKDPIVGWIVCPSPWTVSAMLEAQTKNPFRVLSMFLATLGLLYYFTEVPKASTPPSIADIANYAFVFIMIVPGAGAVLADIGSYLARRDASRKEN